MQIVEIKENIKFVFQKKNQQDIIVLWFLKKVNVEIEFLELIYLNKKHFSFIKNRNMMKCIKNIQNNTI